MEIIKLSILLAAAVCVSARVFRLRLSDDQASYADVMHSLHVIDFNLNEKELETLAKYYQERTKTTPEEMAALIKSEKYEEDVLRMITSAKLQGDVAEFTNYKVNTFMLAINYDLTAQILNPEYEENTFTILIKKNYYSYTKVEREVLDMISKRWAPDVAGNGVSLPEGGLRNFYDGTAEELHHRKLGVLQINADLDRFVLHTLREGKFQFESSFPQFSTYLVEDYKRNDKRFKRG